MHLRLTRWLTAALLLTALHAVAAPTKKKKVSAPPPAAKVESELKSAPTLSPVVAEPEAPAPLSAPPPVVQREPEPELTPLPKLGRRAGVSVQATGGVLVPFSSLGVGGRAELRAAYWLEKLPLALSVGVAFEQHTSRSAARFAPPAGGFDEAAVDNQTLLPLELSLLAALFSDASNRVHLGAGYALLPVWSQTLALGSEVLERGVGHEVAAEAGYTRRWGALELTLRLRYSVRRTAVGARSASLELPWYQTFGALAGLGFWL
ncbi:MAG: hypothetical protein Q8N23_13350 [Archangium sp.]|nr:hypothetical protein [Archangium sp.]MDP3153658.1 hypothetical protein [Archangium sp.]MDP3569294.1 hypothetical protein [Archangium sp.]